jgi:hypothetical protein
MVDALSRGMNATAPVHHPFSATTLGAVGRRQVVAHASVVVQTIAVFCLLGAALWAILA